MSPPSVTVVLPTYNSARFLDGCLESLARQDYEGEVDTLVVDGGSSDDSRVRAERYGAVVIDNPQQHEEAARALGIDAARGELILMLDADNVIPRDDWLARLVAALDLAPDVVSADCLFHEHRAGDPPLVRVCALMGGTDPLAVELGWGDRWAWHLDRWTGMPLLEEERHGSVRLVRIDPDRPPSMGSNGFLVRRDALRRTQYADGLVHSDVVGDLAALGYRFARVELGVVHLYAADLGVYWRKAHRRAMRSLRGEPAQRRGFRPPLPRLALHAAFSASIVGPAALAMRGYRRRPDRAWALYPVISAMTVAAYVRARVTLALERWR